MIISVNGRQCDEQEAVISVYDHGFLYGMGVFETLRTYRSKPFLLAEHMQRLKNGCKELGIEFQPDTAGVEREIHDLLAANGLEDAYVRYTVTAGIQPLGLPAEPYGKPAIVIYVKPLPPLDEPASRTGKPLQLLRTRRTRPETPIRLKSLHYMNNILAKMEMNSYPWSQGAEGLFTDEAGYLAEGLVSNLFFVAGGKLCTPALETGILPGITRQWVIRNAERWVPGLAVAEGLFTEEQLWGAEEVFMTNSVQEIVPVTGIYTPEGQFKQAGTGRPGSVTTALMANYRLTALQ
ncbi:aminotransferase class IV [Paenibacillus sp. y28]|uniref:aminotransferase class IV n=1 Tax=Paenibacillus sp. y28 TaxID=3129110 RepID=UPI0030189E39